MQFGTVYPVVESISPTAGSTLAHYARRKEKEMRNLAQLPIYTFPDVRLTETIGTVIDGKFTTIEKKGKKLSKTDWALTWNASLLGHASRYNQLAEMLVEDEYELGEDVRGETTELTPEQRRKAAAVLEGVTT